MTYPQKSNYLAYFVQDLGWDGAARALYDYLSITPAELLACLAHAMGGKWGAEGAWGYNRDEEHNDLWCCPEDEPGVYTHIIQGKEIVVSYPDGEKVILDDRLLHLPQDSDEQKYVELVEEWKKQRKVMQELDTKIWGYRRKKK